jgi:hypothetical protein
MDHSKYNSAALPSKQDWVIFQDEISALGNGLVELLGLYLVPTALPQVAIIDNGVFVDRYHAPQAPLNGAAPTFSFADQLDGTVQAAQVIDDNQPFPVSGQINVGWFRCSPGGPYVAECTKPVTTVKLDGSGSSDPDDNPLTFDWTGGFTGGSASGETASVQFPNPGTFTVTLKAADSELSTTCDTKVTITVTPDSIENDVRQFLTANEIKNAGLANSLLQMLDAAAKAFTGGDCKTAANIYQSFILALEAQSGKGVDPAAAAKMIGATQCLTAQCT